MPSPYHDRNFQPGHYYHVFNRGAHKNTIFHDPSDYQHFQEIMAYYLTFPTGIGLSQHGKYDHPELHDKNLNTHPTYHLVCYCLMPNHFHFLFRQHQPKQDQNSISSFMRRLSITYSLYYKNKHEHSGTLFQGKFQNVHITSEPQLLQVTKYIHINPGQGLYDQYPYSSYQYYLNSTTTPSWLKPQPILTYFDNHHPHLSYASFVSELTPPSPLTAKQLIDFD